MKFYVWKKRFRHLIANLIVMNLVSMPMPILLTVLVFLGRTGLNDIVFFWALPIFISIILIPKLRHEGSIVSFEDNEINCAFWGKIRRNISYAEIKEYGVFHAGALYDGRSGFICISRIELAEDQRDKTAYRLYYKTKDVIVLEYSEKIMEHLQGKCPHIEPWVEGPDKTWLHNFIQLINEHPEKAGNKEI